MKDDSWKRFIKTGRIADYLQYTACTSEDVMANILVKKKENEETTVEGNNAHHRNRSFCDGNR